MNDVMNFFQDVFSLKAKDSTPVGLSSFKTTTAPAQEIVKTINKKREIKISDLMRRPH